ncbi:MAG: CBS domain-containing protein [Chloroflexi bacterium]|nr:CBS domain-containing protein [Chloroflexota bacterium]
MKISAVLATKGMSVITIHPDQPLDEAIALLSQHNIGALVVVDVAGRPVGILSERDIVRGAANSKDVFAARVQQLMTTNVVTGSPQDDLHSVLQTMTDRHFRHMPIVDEGKLLGIVSIGDVVKAQLNEYKGEIDTLQIRINKG